MRVNKRRAKPDTRLQCGDIVRVPPMRVSEKIEHKPSQNLVRLLKQRVVYESDDLLVVNKPSGLSVHAGSGVRLGLIEALRSGFDSSEGFELVHRLDRATSGCILIAKNRSMLRHLQAGLREEGVVIKRYFALVEGRWPGDLTRVTLPLHKFSGENSAAHVVVDAALGKHAVTDFSVVHYYPGATLIDAYPLTGRTHQIRVHAAHYGHALLGDDKYGQAQTNNHWQALGLKRLFLHAHSLDLPLPDGSRLRLASPLDDDLSALLERLTIEREPV